VLLNSVEILRNATNSLALSQKSGTVSTEVRTSLNNMSQVLSALLLWQDVPMPRMGSDIMSTVQEVAAWRNAVETIERGKFGIMSRLLTNIVTHVFVRNMNLDAIIATYSADPAVSQSVNSLSALLTDLRKYVDASVIQMASTNQFFWKWMDSPYGVWLANKGREVLSAFTDSTVVRNTLEKAGTPVSVQMPLVPAIAVSIPGLQISFISAAGDGTGVAQLAAATFTGRGKVFIENAATAAIDVTAAGQAFNVNVAQAVEFNIGIGETVVIDLPANLDGVVSWRSFTTYEARDAQNCSDVQDVAMGANMTLRGLLGTQRVKEAPGIAYFYRSVFSESVAAYTKIIRSLRPADFNLLTAKYQDYLLIGEDVARPSSWLLTQVFQPNVDTTAFIENVCADYEFIMGASALQSRI
jgi:hypothetical protein